MKATFVLYACGEGGGARSIVGEDDLLFRALELSISPPRGDAFSMLIDVLNFVRIRGGGMRTWSGVGGGAFRPSGCLQYAGCVLFKNDRKEEYVAFLSSGDVFISTSVESSPLTASSFHISSNSLANGSFELDLVNRTGNSSEESDLARFRLLPMSMSISPCSAGESLTSLPSLLFFLFILVFSYKTDLCVCVLSSTF